MTVKLDGTTVFFVEGDSDVDYAVYRPVTIDVSGFAGGTRELVLEGRTVAGPNNPAPGFDIDTVSLQSTPVSSGPTATAAVLPPVQTPVPATKKVQEGSGQEEGGSA